TAAPSGQTGTRQPGGARANRNKGGVGQGKGADAGGAPHSQELPDEEVTDRQRQILETMLQEQITSHRRRKKQSGIVKLINRSHNPPTYKRDFAGLVKRGWLQSQSGPTGGVWLSHHFKSEIQRILSLQ